MDTHPRRQLVFQILRLIMWALIAAAMVKIAFFPPHTETDPVVGQGTFELPTVEATTMDINNTQTFDATIVRDESTPVKSSAEGTINHMFVENGSAVNIGDRILQIRSETTTESNNPEEMPRTITTYTDIKATAAGTVHFDVVLHQNAAIGDTLGKIQAGTFHAAVQLTPEKLYELQVLPTDGTITITDGPAPFTCTNVHTTLPTSTTPNPDGTTAQQSTPELRCTIPSDQTVFEGLKAKLNLAGESATGVIAVPITAVEGRFREGNVYLPATEKGEKPTALKVEIGINNGEYVHIKSGLNEGDTILEFVPSAEPDEESDEFSYGM